jgi:hypothetical protein
LLLLFLLLSLKAININTSHLPMVVTPSSSDVNNAQVKCSLVLMDESSDQVFIGIVGVPESGKSVECIQHNKQEA